jgi:hypothetical protein
LKVLGTGRAADEPEELLGDAAVEDALSCQQRESMVSKRKSTKENRFIFGARFGVLKLRSGQRTKTQSIH